MREAATVKIAKNTYRLSKYCDVSVKGIIKLFSSKCELFTSIGLG